MPVPDRAETSADANATAFAATGFANNGDLWVQVHPW